MIFQKISVTSKGKIHMEYEVSNGNDVDEFSFTCGDEPKPEFRAALQDLAQDVIEMCELPDHYLSRINVTGVSFSYGGESAVMGATIISQMSLSKSYVALNLNTPHKASEPYADGEDGNKDPKQLLSEDCVERLEDLIREAQDYVNGIRAQKKFSFADMEQPRGQGQAATASA